MFLAIGKNSNDYFLYTVAVPSDTYGCVDVIYRYKERIIVRRLYIGYFDYKYKHMSVEEVTLFKILFE